MDYWQSNDLTPMFWVVKLERWSLSEREIMDVKSIVTFLEVANTKSFSVTANNLNVTQPAVSKRVATLETQLSTRLFDRVGKRVHLTEAGKLLIPSAQKIAAEVDQIEAQISRLNDTVAGILSLGVSPYVASGYLPEYLKYFSAEFPDVKISLEVRQSQQLLEELKNGMFDIGLCELDKPQNEDIKQHYICREMLCCAVSEHHPLGEFSNTSIEELIQYPAVLPPPDSTSRVQLSNALALNGYREKQHIDVPDFNTLKSMIDSGIGWGFLPETMCQSDDTLRILNVEKITLAISTFLVHLHGRTLSHAATAFARAMPISVYDDSLNNLYRKV